jgi:peptide/nickel transport system substrate-binding protein
LRPVKLLAAAVLVIAVSLVAVAGSPAASDQKTTVTVATIRPVDTLNPAIGALVFDYEVWNQVFPTVTRKAAADFATTPGLASSWKASDGGRTYTYTIRPNLKWSDGQPLTAEDAAYTIDRSRKEQWLNYTSFTGDLVATAPNATTLVVHSTAPDPKLPSLGDTYIVPKHIWEKVPASQVSKYNALEGTGGVAGGPYVLKELKKGQYARMEANPNWWEGKPKVDQVIIRQFNNPDAMVAALKNGEVDAVYEVPAGSFNSLKGLKDIETTPAIQGSFNELAINAGDGVAQPHPALLDPRVRQAIAHAIDRKTIVEKVYAGNAQAATTIAPSADPAWIPDIPQSQQYEFDLAKANKILDDAGYKDTDGDGIREMPGGGKPLVFRYVQRSDSEVAAPIEEYLSGWFKKIGIGLKVSIASDSQLTPIIGKGDYDMFVWGWTPYVDPDPQLEDFICSKIATAKDPSDYGNDANWCNKAYDKLYEAQHVELDPKKRMQLVHQMLTLFYKSAVYDALVYEPDLNAYRTNRVTGWLKQPEPNGPVVFSNTSPSYANLTPVAASSGGGGGLPTAGIGAIIVVALGAVALVVVFLRRRRTAGERE